MNQIDFFAAKMQYEIDACDLNRLFHEDASDYVIIDARSERAFKIEHIKGAVSLSYSSMNEETVKHLDKNKVYVTYCDGLFCNASTKGALKLSELNFKVKELIGGLDAWKSEGHEIASSLSIVQKEEASSCGHMCSCHN